MGTGEGEVGSGVAHVPEEEEFSEPYELPETEEEQKGLVGYLHPLLIPPPTPSGVPFLLCLTQ